jgi:hypothetical protein
MAEQRAALEPDTSLLRMAEDVAELKGEMRQIDRRLTSLEQGQQDLRKSMEQGQQDLRKDVRQVLYLVVVGILVPILLQILRDTTAR